MRLPPEVVARIWWPRLATRAGATPLFRYAVVTDRRKCTIGGFRYAVVTDPAESDRPAETALLAGSGMPWCPTQGQATMVRICVMTILVTMATG